MKRALLTGASSGIGQAIAPLLANDGYALGLIGRAESSLEKLIAAFPEAVRKESAVVSADLADPNQVTSVLERWGKEVDLLINCAGVGVTGLIESLPLEEFERCFQVNFLSCVSLIQQILPQMKKRGSGQIVNVSSGVAKRALPFHSPYCSAKAALDSFTDSLRVETARYSIDILLFSPGPVATRFHDNSIHHGEPLAHKPPFHGKEAKYVAVELLRAIKEKKKRVVLGHKAKLAHHLQYWTPELTDKLIAKSFRI